jgi:hypothetical protein
MEDPWVGLIEGWDGRFGVGDGVGRRLNGAGRGNWTRAEPGCAAAGWEIFTGVRL